MRAMRVWACTAVVLLGCCEVASAGMLVSVRVALHRTIPDSGEVVIGARLVNEGDVPIVFDDFTVPGQAEGEFDVGGGWTHPEPGVPLPGLATGNWGTFSGRTVDPGESVDFVLFTFPSPGDAFGPSFGFRFGFEIGTYEYEDTGGHRDLAWQNDRAVLTFDVGGAPAVGPEDRVRLFGPMEAAPEPSTLALGLVALPALCLWARRRKRA